MTALEQSHLALDVLAYLTLGFFCGRESNAWYRRRQGKKRMIETPIPSDFSASAVNYMLARARSLRLGAALQVIYKQGDWIISEWRIQFERGTIVSRGIGISENEKEFEQDPPAKM